MATYEERKKNEEWKKEHIKMVKSDVANSPRGDFYFYAMLYDGKVYEIGDEQGNYSGGTLASVEGDGYEQFKEYVKRLADWENGYCPNLYEKIKNCPIMTDEEWEDFSKEYKKHK